jgi:branched-chain amino acid transport system permease protein
LVGFVAPNNFTIYESIRFLVMLVVGGLGSIPGSYLGAILITILPEALRAWEEYYIAAYALGIIVVLLGFPRGLGAVADWFLEPATRTPLSQAQRVSPPRPETEEGFGAP